jgi:hypothetical protein
MKKCTKCLDVKNLILFATKSSSKDGKATWCKQCFAEHAAWKYQNGDRIRKEKNKANLIARNRIKMREYLDTHPCVDCGISNFKVLTFDHRNPEEKIRNVSEMFPWSWLNILTEIAKCDVRCANCHMIRTSIQFGFWKSK